MPISPYATAIAQADAVRSGEISASDLLAQQLERVERLDPEINAVVWRDVEAARAEARACDEEAAAGTFRGPLHGVPMTVKESFDIAGAPSTWGSPAWRDNIAAVDSDVVARYRAAGAVIFGKTNVPLMLADWQSFNEVYGATNNPWDLTRSPGGSSGGSGAALASGMSALEAGSDIGSSIRNPAHYCGVFGLKPTWGVVSYQGQNPPGWIGHVDISVAGPLARSADDLTLGFDILAGPDRERRDAWALGCPDDPRTAVKDFRIALKLDDPEAEVDQGYVETLDAFAEALTKAGATVDRAAAPAVDPGAHFTMYLKLLGAALAAYTTPEELATLKAALEAVGDPRTTRVFGPRLDGVAMSHAEWLRIDNQRQVARRAFDAFYEDYDLLISPVARTAAFTHMREGRRFERFFEVNGKREPEITQLFWAGYSGVVGLPSVVGPAGFVGGLPVGYQATAGFGRDRTALAFARAVEREIGGFTPPPNYP